MALKSFKPYTKSTRSTILIEVICGKKPEKSQQSLKKSCWKK